MGNTCSDYIDMECEVPQSTVLVPILFLIYVNEIFQSSDMSHIIAMLMTQLYFLMVITEVMHVS